MVQGVYVDVLLALNFLVDFLLLSLLAQICGRAGESRFKLALAAAVGSLFSLAIFLPPPSFFGRLLFNTISALVMLLAAFSFKGFHTLCREWLLLMLITAAFYGILILLGRLFSLSGIFVFGSAVYLDIRAPTFIISLSAAYVLVWLANRILKSMCNADELYSVELSVDGKTENFIGFLDTGNNLSEPFSGCPVIVCGLDSAAKLLSSKLLTAMLGTANEESAKVRQIPFSAVSGTGLLPAVKGEMLKLRQGEEEYISNSFYLAVSSEKIGCDDWQLLLSRRIFNACEKGKVTR